MADLERLIAETAQRTGIDPNLLRTFVRIESGGNPNVRTGSYKGLLQLSDSEFAKYGGQGNIFDPAANLAAGARKLQTETARLKSHLGRDPTPADLYLVHQQGPAGSRAHWSNPEGVAWQNVRPYYTDEAARRKGFADGDAYAKAAIWGNVPTDVRERYGNVDNMTSQQFVDMWTSKVGRFGGQAPTAVASAGAAPSSPPQQSNGIAPTYTAKADLGPVASAAAPAEPPAIKDGGIMGFLKSPGFSAIAKGLMAQPKSPEPDAPRIDIPQPQALRGRKMANVPLPYGVKPFAAGGAVDDTGMNVPEDESSLYAQQEQLLEGRRLAQMFPIGTPELPLPDGFERVETPRGVFHFDPDMITAEDIIEISAQGRENEVLGLGPHSKDDVLDDAMATGEKPFAITERDRDGNEVRASASTSNTLADQADHILRTARPDHTVNLEPMDGVLEKRGLLNPKPKMRRADGGGIAGPLMGDTGGRSDHLETSVPAGSHVIPADVVSHMGEGNTMAGMKILDQMFKSAPKPSAMSGIALGAAPGMPMRAAGGGIGVFADLTPEVPVRLSDGEYVVEPDVVAELGAGDVEAGHDILDAFILAQRDQAIEELQNLPPPATGEEDGMRADGGNMVGAMMGMRS